MLTFNFCSEEEEHLLYRCAAKASKGPGPKATKVPNAKANNANCLAGGGGASGSAGRGVVCVSRRVALRRRRCSCYSKLTLRHLRDATRRAVPPTWSPGPAHKLAPTFNYSIIFINFLLRHGWGRRGTGAQALIMCVTHSHDRGGRVCGRGCG